MLIDSFKASGILRPHSAVSSLGRLLFCTTRSSRHQYDIIPRAYPRQFLCPSPSFRSYSCRSSTSTRISTSSTATRRPRLAVEQRRHCSYQRTMCRQYGFTDAVASNVDVSKGREVLPKNVRPTHYRLTLEPDLENFEFDGLVEIEYVTSVPGV
jgi:hypothetical protein